MCCQITPAIGIDPMKPITTMRLRFIFQPRRTRSDETRAEDCPEIAQINADFVNRSETGHPLRACISLRKSAKSLGELSCSCPSWSSWWFEVPNDNRRIPSDDCVWFNAFGNH